MSEEPILYESSGTLATITLNRPAVLNAFTPEMLQALEAALRRAAGEGCRAILLTGAGRGFSAGMDLASIKDDYEHGGPDFVALLKNHFYPMLRELTGTAMPVVAAVNGVAAGAGMSLALACDLRIAADNARFVTAFTNIGLVPDCGMAYTLPRLVGAGRAAEMMMLSAPVSAGEALVIGLVNRVVPADDLPNEAVALASRLAAGPTRAYVGTRALMGAAATKDLREFLEFEASRQAEAGATNDHRDAVAAFLRKEPPRFEGR